MMKTIIFSIIFVVTLAAKADIEFAALAGLRSNSANTDIASATVTSQTSYMAGLLGFLPLRSGFGVRSGVIFNQRFVKLGPTAKGDIDIQYTYMDVPLTGTYQFNNALWIFLGPNLAFNQSRDVTCSKSSNCSAADVKSFVLPWQFGVDFKLTPQVGGEVFYEFMSGDLSANVSDMKAIGASFLIFFN